MMFRHPFAAAHGAVLGDEADAARRAVEIHGHRRGIVRPVELFAFDVAQPADDVRRRYPLRILGAGDHRLDIGVDVEVVEEFGLANDVRLGEYAAQRRIELLLGIRQE